MKKLRLDLDQIQVATFSTDEISSSRGTVQALAEGNTYTTYCGSKGYAATCADWDCAHYSEESVMWCPTP